MVALKSAIQLRSGRISSKSRVIKHNNGKIFHRSLKINISLYSLSIGAINPARPIMLEQREV